MTDPLREYDSIHLTREAQTHESATLAIEVTIPVFLNDRRIALLTASPDMLRELGAGYTVSEGLAAPSEIRDVEVKNSEIHITADSPDLELWHELRSSGCIGITFENQEQVHVDSDSTFDPSVIWDSLVHLNSRVYQVSRGAHSATIITNSGEVVARAVDIGRHCAVDKAIGSAVLAGRGLGDCFLLSSGRQSRGMVLKVARAGIPMIVSKAAPLSSGVDAAVEAGVTLVCYADREKIRVFAHPERLSGVNV